MKGCFTVKRLLPNKHYYVSSKDYDSRLGGEFRLFIHPFSIDDGNAFYYVRQLTDEDIQVEGEGYIVNDEDSLNRHKADARRTFAGNQIWYYWLDEASNIIEKEVIKCSTQKDRNHEYGKKIRKSSKDHLAGGCCM